MEDFVRTDGQVRSAIGIGRERNGESRSVLSRPLRSVGAFRKRGSHMKVRGRRRFLVVLFGKKKGRVLPVPFAFVSVVRRQPTSSTSSPFFFAISRNLSTRSGSSPSAITSSVSKSSTLSPVSTTWSSSFFMGEIRLQTERFLRSTFCEWTLLC